MRRNRSQVVGVGQELDEIAFELDNGHLGGDHRLGDLPLRLYSGDRLGRLRRQQAARIHQRLRGHPQPAGVPEADRVLVVLPRSFQAIAVRPCRPARRTQIVTQLAQGRYPWARVPLEAISRLATPRRRDPSDCRPQLSGQLLGISRERSEGVRVLPDRARIAGRKARHPCRPQLPEAAWRAPSASASL